MLWYFSVVSLYSCTEDESWWWKAACPSFVSVLVYTREIGKRPFVLELKSVVVTVSVPLL